MWFNRVAAVILLVSSFSPSQQSTSEEQGQAFSQQILSARGGITGIVFRLILLSVASIGPSYQYFDRNDVSVISTQLKSAVKQTVATLSRRNFRGSGYIDEDLGPFYANGSYCDSKCNRQFVCFSPVKPNEIGLRLILRNSYTMKRQIGPDVVLTYKDGYRAKALLTSGTVVLLLNGGVANPLLDETQNRSRDVWLLRKDANVSTIVVDYSDSNMSPILIVPNIRVVRAMIGYFIKSLGIADRTRCDGLSNGAQVCGEAGKWHQRHSQGKKIAICTGLDMAAPFFEGCDNEVKLDKSDCGVVNTIHTNNNPFKKGYLGLGNPENTGHCNFHLNSGRGWNPLYRSRCGSQQPGCLSADPVAALTAFSQNARSLPYQFSIAPLLCEHTRSFFVYESQVDPNSSCRLEGKQFADPKGGQPYLPCDGKGPFKPSQMFLPPNDNCKETDDMVLFVETGPGPGANFCSREL